MFLYPSPHTSFAADYLKSCVTAWNTLSIEEPDKDIPCEPRKIQKFHNFLSCKLFNFLAVFIFPGDP